LRDDESVIYGHFCDIFVTKAKIAERRLFEILDEKIDRLG